MKPLKRSVFVKSLLAAAALAANGLPALAQSGFPSKPVTIVTAFPAGSGPDSVIRAVGEKLSKIWNQPVLINNKPGGGGFIAIDAAIRAPADGYTLIQLDNEHLAALPVLSQLFTSVGSGELQWSFATLPSSAGIFKAGKLRYIAVASPNRLPQMPDVPTVSEAGGPPGFDLTSYMALLSPKGLPKEIQAKIHADMMTALADPDIKSRFNTFAFEAINWSPEEMRRVSEAKMKVYEELARRKNISLE